jgi:hypothetical protein
MSKSFRSERKRDAPRKPSPTDGGYFSRLLEARHNSTWRRESPGDNLGRTRPAPDSDSLNYDDEGGGTP